MGAAPATLVPIVRVSKSELDPRTAPVSPVVGAKILSGLIPCNVIPEEILTEHPRRYRALIVDADGPRWSQPFIEPGEPFGIPEEADVLDLDGQPIERITVYRTEIGDSIGAMVLVPEPSNGWHSIKLNDALPLAFTAPITVPNPQ